MAKEIKQDSVAEIRKHLEGKKLVLGTERTLKSLRAGKVEKVFMTSNCPNDIRNDFSHLSRISDVKIIELDVPNDELGTICKKPFSISVAGLLRV